MVRCVYKKLTLLAVAARASSCVALWLPLYSFLGRSWAVPCPYFRSGPSAYIWPAGSWGKTTNHWALEKKRAPFPLAQDELEGAEGTSTGQY